MDTNSSYVAVNMMERIGPVRVRSLGAALGSVDAIMTASADELMRADGIGPEVARCIVEQRDAIDPAREIARAKSLGCRLLTRPETEYPGQLAEIYAPPLALYVRGTLEARDRHAIAIVGTRRPTHYGLTVADRLAYQLAKVGFTVVSGLARGIDTAAHKGALKAGGRTLAVIGSAMDCLYPPENKELADQIAKSGAVLSEFPLGREPDRTTFPYRNRIISGLSMGVVIVEAGLGSGALQTADQALEQGRTVFAVPGRIDTAAAKGSHRLIKNGATLIEDVDDILREFEFLIPPEKKEKAAALDQRPKMQLSDAEQAIVRGLWDGELDMDSLTRKVELKSAAVSSLLIGLEMKRVVRMLPGRRVDLADGIRTDVASIS